MNCFLRKKLQQLYRNVSRLLKYAKAYHTQVVTVDENLSALNSVYEMNFRMPNSHAEDLNKFIQIMTAAMEVLVRLVKNRAFKTTIKLNQNVSS